MIEHDNFSIQTTTLSTDEKRVLVQPLDFSVCTDEFYKAMKFAEGQLKTIGDPDPTEIVVLAHYSENPSIKSFVKGYDPNWTRKVSDTYEIIGNHIGLYSKKWRSIYLIQLGIGPSYKPRGDLNCHMDERAIDLAVGPDDFVKVDLVYDDHAERFRIV